MGGLWSYQKSGFNLHFHPEVTPGPDEEPTFDPLIGFPDGRKPRGRYLFYTSLATYCYVNPFRNEGYRSRNEIS